MTGTLTLLVSALTLLLSLSAGTDTTKSAIVAEFGTTTPFMLGSAEMEASIADSPEERQLGLSHTVSLPTNVAKVFVFEEAGLWSFWMKDMNYAIDIIWVAEDGSVVHIESHMAPETFPSTFAPTIPAKYVIEVEAGLAAQQGITVGSRIDTAGFIVK